MTHVPRVNRLPLDRKLEIFRDALDQGYIMTVQEFTPNRETTGVGFNSALGAIKLDRFSSLTIIYRPTLFGGDLDHWEVCWDNSTHYIRICLAPKVTETFFAIHGLKTETR